VNAKKPCKRETSARGVALCHDFPFLQEVIGGSLNFGKVVVGFV